MKSLFVVFLTLVLMSSELSPSSILLTVEGIETAKGNLMVALCDSEGEMLKPYVFPVKNTGTSTNQIVLPESGTYTLKVYQDINKNGKLDKSFIGIPKEPVAFSNNAWSDFGPAPLEDQRFEVGSGETFKMKIRLRSF